MVAFSCTGRGFGACCGGRRMAERAAHPGLKAADVASVLAAIPPRLGLPVLRSQGPPPLYVPLGRFRLTPAFRRNNSWKLHRDV